MEELSRLLKDAKDAWNEGFRLLMAPINEGLSFHKLHIECEQPRDDDSVSHAKSTLRRSLHQLRSLLGTDLSLQLHQLEENLENEVPWVLGCLSNETEIIGVTLQDASENEPYIFQSSNFANGMLPRGWEGKDLKERVVTIVDRNKEIWLGFFERIEASLSMGVSLSDLAFAYEYDENDVPQIVKKWIDSKKLQLRPIGKCPKDKRANLYKLSELLEEFFKGQKINSKEKSEIYRILKKKLRAPVSPN